MTLYLLLEYGEVVSICRTTDQICSEARARWPDASIDHMTIVTGYGEVVGEIQKIVLSDELASALVMRGLGALV